MVNQNLGNHGPGIFLCDRIWPLFQGQMRIAKISVYILLIRIPRGLQCHTNL